jgi:hypothetical protein
MESRFPSARLSGESPDGTESSHATESHLAGLGGLHGERLSHDGAATSNGLQVGHAATTRGSVAGRGRERAEGSRRGLLQERTHGLRLTKYGVHDGRIDSFSSFGIVFFFLRGYIRGEGCCVEEVGGGRFLMSSTLPSEV